MKKLFAVALLSAAVATPAIAADQLYVGVDVGPSSLGGASSTAFGALVGYKLDKSATRFMGNGSLAIEGQYTSLGSISYSFFGYSVDEKFSSIGVDAVAMFPIPSVKNLSAFGKLGIASTSATVSCSGAFGCGSGYANTSGLVFGLGAEYGIDKHMAVRAGYQTYASDISTIYVAGIYSF